MANIDNIKDMYKAYKQLEAEDKAYVNGVMQGILLGKERRDIPADTAKPA